MQELIPDKAGVRAVRGIVAAGLISTILWAGVVVIPLIVF